MSQLVVKTEAVDDDPIEGRYAFWFVRDAETGDVVDSGCAATEEDARRAGEEFVAGVNKETA